MRLRAGLLFASDSRTNAGVDHIATFRKMNVFEQPGERLITLLNAGNLATTQSVVSLLRQRAVGQGAHLMNLTSMYDVAELVGKTLKEVVARDSDGPGQLNQGVDFGANFIVGGQIRGEPPRLFSIYAAGNYIEATDESPYFQIGELKYGKPILDRVITPDTTLDEAAKCALVSMDSTLRSNISVGMPLDLLVYEADALAVTRFVTIDWSNPYYRMISTTWGTRLRQVFSEIPNPTWHEGSDRSHALLGGTPPRAAVPPEIAAAATQGEPAPLHTVAGPARTPQ